METIVTAILVGIILLVCVAFKKDDITAAQKEIKEQKKSRKPIFLYWRLLWNVGC